MELDIFSLFVNYGWQVATVALGTIFLIGVNKLWLRKLVKNSNARHGIYTIFNFVFVGLLSILTITASNGLKLDWTAIWKTALVGYGLLNILYPLYENLSIKDLVSKIGKAIVKGVARKPEIVEFMGVVKKEPEKKPIIITSNEPTKKE